MFCLGCSGQEEADGQALCEDAAQAVAQRTVACEGDTELANSRYAGVLEGVRCIAAVTDNATPDTRCAAAILSISCDEVAALGNDYVAWADRPACDGTFDMGTDGGAPDAMGDAP
jgi:hypothetical protein